jgi:uncharacterized lipoprotein YmbA
MNSTQHPCCFTVFPQSGSVRSGRPGSDASAPCRPGLHPHVLINAALRCGASGKPSTDNRFNDFPFPLLLALTLSAALTSCSFLKPAQSTARHFVLTPMPAPTQAAAGPATIAVGVGKVKLPAYLFSSFLALRRGTNEIEYLQSAVWAERLDTGFQRVLAANLASVLSTDRIYMSGWQTDDVAAEVYVAIERFDIDATGRGVLVARWRVLSAGGEKILKSGTGRLSRQGPSPDAGASGMVDTLSELVADLSRQLGQAIQETARFRSTTSLQAPSSDASSFQIVDQLEPNAWRDVGRVSVSISCVGPPFGS